MKIKELNISEFGGLKNKRLEFDDGMNIIYGANESGKSTVLLFIKFMLYGLGRKSSANSERERSISWDGHTAAGNMTFSYNGFCYRIERRYTEATRGGNEKISIVCLDNGSEIATDKEPGEYFFGVPKEVFESSACVGQMGSTDINGEKTAISIQNLLNSADEKVDTSKILKTLDNVRITYRHKTGNGGSLYETEQKLISRKQRLDKAREDAVLLEEQTQRLEIAQRDYEIAKRDFEASDTLLTELNKISIIKRFDECAKKDDELLMIGDRRREHVRTNLTTDFIPTSQHLAELRHAAGRLESADKRLREKQTELDGISRDYDEGAALLGEKIEQNGGADAILGSLREQKKKRKKQTVTAVLISSVGVLASGAAVPFILMQQLWGFAFLAFLSLVPIAFVITVSKKKKIKAKMLEIADEYGATADTLFERLEYCLKNLSQKRSFESANAIRHAEVSQAEHEVTLAREELASLLQKTTLTLSASIENAKNEYRRIAEFIAENDAMLKEEDALKRVVEMEKEALAQYNCEVLKSEISTDLSALTPTALAEAERSKNFLQRKKEVLENKIFGLRENVIQLRANATDPFPIADEIAELEKKKADDNEFYSALTLAISAMEQAGSAISGNVMPSIMSKASEFMARISGDKYTSVRATSNFKQLSLDSEGYGIKSEFLSAGTRDAAYLSLRIALFDRIYTSDRPPLLFDEALCQLDDTRAKNMLTLIKDITDRDMQSLLFTSHKREEQICGNENFEYNSIRL